MSSERVTNTPEELIKLAEVFVILNCPKIASGLVWGAATESIIRLAEENFFISLEKHHSMCGFIEALMTAMSKRKYSIAVLWAGWKGAKE